MYLDWKRSTEFTAFSISSTLQACAVGWVGRVGRWSKEAILRSLWQGGPTEHRGSWVAGYWFGVNHLHGFKHHINRHDHCCGYFTQLFVTVLMIMSWTFSKQKASVAAMASVQFWQGAVWGLCSSQSTLCGGSLWLINLCKFENARIMKNSRDAWATSHAPEGTLATPSRPLNQPSCSSWNSWSMLTLNSIELVFGRSRRLTASPAV